MIEEFKKSHPYGESGGGPRAREDKRSSAKPPRGEAAPARGAAAAT